MNYFYPSFNKISKLINTLEDKSNILMTDIGSKIKKLREIRGITQSYMAVKLKISQSQYSYLENKQKKITEKDINLIARLLNVTTEYIRNFNFSDLITSENKKSTELSRSELNNSDKFQITILLELIADLKAQLEALRKENKSLQNNNTMVQR